MADRRSGGTRTDGDLRTFHARRHPFRLPLEGRDDYENRWIEDFLRGLREQFAKQDREHPEWALVFTKHPVVVDTNETHRTQLGLKPGKKKQITLAKDEEAYQAGYEAGRAFSKPKAKIEAHG